MPALEDGDSFEPGEGNCPKGLVCFSPRGIARVYTALRLLYKYATDAEHLCIERDPK